MPGTTDDLLDQTHREVDTRLLTLALEHTGGNHSEAAKLLGISRQTLRVRLRGLGLRLAASIQTDDSD